MLLLSLKLRMIKVAQGSLNSDFFVRDLHNIEDFLITDEQPFAVLKNKTL
jgi:hypothetical protein